MRACIEILSFVKSGDSNHINVEQDPSPAMGLQTRHMRDVDVPRRRGRLLYSARSARRSRAVLTQLLRLLVHKARFQHFKLLPQHGHDNHVVMSAGLVYISAQHAFLLKAEHLAHE